MCLASDCADDILGLYALGFADIDEESDHTRLRTRILELAAKVAVSAGIVPAVASLPSLISAESLGSLRSIIAVKAVFAVFAP